MENQSGTFIPNPNDFAMPKWLVKCELSMGAKLVYLILTICAGRQDFAFPSQEFLSQATSVCVRTLQRYLKALSDFGLIRIDKRKVHGTMRTVYCFLNHAVMDFEKKRPAAPAEEPNPATAGPGGGVLENLSYEGDKSVRERGDNFSTASYKEEGYGKNNNTPLPPAASSPSIEPPSAPQTAPGREDCFSGVEEKSDSKEENTLWNQIKNKLTSILSDSDVKIWIEPIRFEIGDAQPVLRFPNQFFMNWVKKHYESSLTEAFRQHGLSEPKFELFTESQLQALERRQTEEALAALAGTEAKASRPETAEEDVEALPLEDQYARLYQAYPRRECRENGWKVFSRLHRANRLPKISKLIRAVNRAKSENQSWQRENGRYAPQIHKWLLERRWMD